MKNIVLFIISLLLYFIAPAAFSPLFISLCAIVFVIGCTQIILHDIRVLELGIFNFNTLFLLSSFATVFLFPLFIYSSGALGFERFLVFKESTVNKCVAMSTMAMSAYFSVYLETSSRYLLSRLKPTPHYTVPVKAIRSLNIWSFILVIIFTVNFFVFIRNTTYEETNLNINTFIIELTFCFLGTNLLVTTINNEHAINNNLRGFIRCNAIPLSLLLIVLIEYLFISDRGSIIMIIVTIGFVYNTYCKKVTTRTFLLAIIVGVVIMSLIAQLRKTDSSFRSGGISSFVSASNEIVSSNELGALDYLSDLTIVSCVSYIGYDIKNEQGFFHPERIFIILANPIPFAPKFISSILYGAYSPRVASTSRVITEFFHESNGDFGNGGIGTSMIIDIYMSWGVVCVIIAFSLFAFVMGRANTLYRHDIFSMIIVFSYIGMALYVPRSTLYICYRSIVWSVLLIKFYRIKTGPISKETNVN